MGPAEKGWRKTGGRAGEAPLAMNKRIIAMSLYGALLTGVSGLDANSRALAITSSNIANVNTVGYKTSIANFSTFLASTGSAETVSPSSVQAHASQLLTQQGLLSSTNSPTDLAISGDGFFVVTDNLAAPTTSTFYT